ncbi:MAG: YIP1 family protein [Candidatus Hodarchaeales archaeon]|jgi:hypothetical protein
MSESESHVCPNCSERSPTGYILCPYCGYDLTKLLRATQRVRITFREKFSRIFRSLYDPRISKPLFTEIGVNPDRFGAFITLYLLSVAYSVRLPVILSKGANNSWRGLQFLYILIGPWFIAMAVIILALFGWVMISAVVWLIAKTLGGKAGFRDTLSVVGYSFGPLITASLIVNALIFFLGAGLGTVDANTWTQYQIFDFLYLPFIVLVIFHCGNGIRTAHLLNDYYSYGIGSAIALFYVVLFVFPAVL